ncbi:MAG TPA: S-layer homology domain-containing protein, partial [Blastocatellia bacterium]|nr:S-layer homology domain-containing protein [Blastocatellia bacterium]
MRSQLRIVLLTVGVFSLTAFFLATTHATNHITQIRQVMTGFNGDASIQFVEMRMSDASQNEWANRTRLVFSNAAGVQTGEFPITSNPPGGTNRSVLFATLAFANLPGAPMPDFIIPAGLLQPGSGKVCFKSPSPSGDPSDPFPVILCLSYGSFAGDTEGGGTPAPALPSTGAQSLKRLDLFSGVFGVNTNSHFALADSAPQNSAGISKGFSPDLSITKTHSGNFTAGTNGAYNITVQNQGIGSLATSGTTTVTDTLPAGLSFVSGTGTGWSCSAVGQTVTCTNANPIAVGSSSAITLTVGVSGAGGQSITNNATVSSLGEHNSANNTASNPTNIVIPCSNTQIKFGQTLSGSLAVGDCSAPHFPLIPERLADLFSFSGFAGQHVAISMNSTPSGADPFLFLIDPNGAQVASNDGCGGSTLDSCIPNNAGSGGFFTLPSTGVYTIEATTAIPGSIFNYTVSLLTDVSSDLSLTKTHSGSFVVGMNGLYTMTVQNNGPQPTQGTTVVTDTLPAGLSFVSGTGTDWSCSAVGQTVTCTNSNAIASSSSSSIDLTVAVAGAAGPMTSNTASVFSGSADSNFSNNSATDPTAVVGDNHLVQIRQVMTGANGNANNQFIEIRMSDATQSFWTNRVKLNFFDSADNPTGEFIIPASPGGTNKSVLLATQSFSGLPGAPMPDFIIPAGLLQPGNGKVCFKNTGEPTAAPINLCLSYGSFSGDLEGGGPAGPALGTAGARALLRQDAFADQFGGPPLNDPGSNQNSHFAMSDARPEGSLGPTSPMSFFFDVMDNHFARRHIQAIANAGITSGCGNTNYCPESAVTRAQMSIFIIRAMGESAATPTGLFADVPIGSFADGFIERMSQLGITSGCGGGNFCPNSSVTRAQMSIFIIRALGESPATPSGMFADVPIGSFADGFIERMAQLGITSGCGGGNFCPD